MREMHAFESSETMGEDSRVTPKRRPNAFPASQTAAANVGRQGHLPAAAETRCFQRTQSSPLLLQTDTAEMSAASALDPVRLGFSWLQSNQINRESHRSTPCKFTSNVLNPFESDLIETMQMSSCSPSVFSRVVTPSKAQNENGVFSWGVENAALLYPKEFGENHNQTAPMVDEEMEEKLQSAINTFFTQKIYVPSPWVDNSGREMSRSSMNAENNCTEHKNNNKRNVRCQTTLSIPVDVDLKSILADYFKSNESGDDDEEDDDESGREMLSISNLRRKLFGDGEIQLKSNAVALSSANSTQDKNCSMEPINLTSPERFDVADSSPRRYDRATSLSPPKHIQTPTDSPIKPFSDDTSQEIKSNEVSMSCSLSVPNSEARLASIDEQNEEVLRVVRSPENMLNVEVFNWDSTVEAVAGGPSAVEKDTGYQTTGTMPTVSSFFTNSAAQIPLLTLRSAGDSGANVDLAVNDHQQQRQLLVPNVYANNLSSDNKSRLQSDTSWSPSVFSTPSKQTD